jgi:hypothetical protein
VQFARDIGGYLSGLVLFREGHVDAWVGWFADAVDHAAERTVVVLSAVEELVARWADAASNLRRDAAARRLVSRLAGSPLWTTAHFRVVQPRHVEAFELLPLTLGLPPPSITSRLRSANAPASTLGKPNGNQIGATRRTARIFRTMTPHLSSTNGRDGTAPDESGPIVAPEGRGFESRRSPQ